MWVNIKYGIPEGAGVCIIPWLKLNVIKFIRGKIRPWLRETYSILNVGKMHPSGYHWMCLLLMEI